MRIVQWPRGRYVNVNAALVDVPTSYEIASHSFIAACKIINSVGRLFVSQQPPAIQSSVTIRHRREPSAGIMGQDHAILPFIIRESLATPPAMPHPTTTVCNDARSDLSTF
ncbi:hypothetical protein J6590_005801 [Homalodisca vitripennis]|nr:hypothetical protein J6590_005801 [Homalodisca vitripennis]